MQVRMRNYLLILVMLLSGCSTIGSSQPQDFHERLAASYSTVTGIRDSATQLLNMKRISSAAHRKITEQLQVARTALDTADIVERAGNLKDADTRLVAVRTILSALQEYLAANSQGAR